MTFGEYVFIGPNCTFTTAEHALDSDMRKNGIEISKLITIGNNVWIGAGSVVLAGVPCKVLRKINEEDKHRYPTYDGAY